jgi:hypothetical protein
MELAIYNCSSMREIVRGSFHHPYFIHPLFTTHLTSKSFPIQQQKSLANQNEMPGYSYL